MNNSIVHNNGRVESSKTINSFGIGSFIFKVSSRQVEKIEVHISNFLEQLRKIPGIENISIKQDSLVFKNITPHEGEVNLSFLDLEFDIDLSTGSFSKEGENKFKFISRTQYDSVVTIVFPYFETQDPSMGIMRVREHIRSFLTSPYSLEVIGPSPFHADFFIHRTNFFGVDIQKSRGYDHVNVHVESSTNDDVIDEVYGELVDELNLFYLVRNTELMRIRSWVEIKKLVSKILEKPKFLSISIEDQFFFRPNYLAKAMRALAEFEADSLIFNQIINERFTSTYSTQKDFLISYINEEKNDVYKYPVESTQNLLKFIADSRNKVRETFNTYVNTIVNVILGAGVAIALYFLGIK